jgi:hypothetical protein
MTDKYGPGNWGWLNIPNGWNGASGPSNGGGASQLNTNITNGCTCDVKVGDVVATKTGEDWGQTLAAVNTLDYRRIAAEHDHRQGITIGHGTDCELGNCQRRFNGYGAGLRRALDR